jgi:carboxylesterase type B
VDTGFSIGNAHSSFYNGSRFAEATGAIIVTLTYRLNVFGFPGAPGNVQNLGFRDQRRAVEWVHQNIANFGGDSSKITIFGQSSGGVAADWWTFAYQDNPLISGIVSESGNAFSFPLNTHEQQTKNWYNVSATLGCGSSGATLDCVRAKGWKDVLAAAAKLPASPGGNPVRSTPAFYPTVDNVTVFSGYASLLEQGKFAKIVSPSESNKHPITQTFQQYLTKPPLAPTPRQQQLRARLLRDPGLRQRHQHHASATRPIPARILHMSQRLRSPRSQSPQRTGLAVPLLRGLA